MLKTGRTTKSEWLSGDIFDDRPKTWRDLQNYVAQLFREIGYAEVKTPYKLPGVRVTKELDVYAVDASVVPPIKIACECKHWNSNVPLGEVMQLAKVVEDSGLNRAFVISKVGFQRGAHRAARSTPIILLDFEAFLELFFESWLRAMSIRLDRTVNSLFPFFDLYWFETLPELSKDKFDAFAALRQKYRLLFSFGPRIPDGHQPPVSMGVTARNPEITEPLKELGIKSYRQFFDTLFAMADGARLEFCTLFGIDPKSLSATQV